jgi:hypothetical protein
VLQDEWQVCGTCVTVFEVLCLTFIPYDDSVLLEEMLTNIDVSKHFRDLITEGVKYVKVIF